MYVQFGVARLKNSFFCALGTFVFFLRSVSSQSQSGGVFSIIVKHGVCHVIIVFNRINASLVDFDLLVDSPADNPLGAGVISLLVVCVVV